MHTSESKSRLSAGAAARLVAALAVLLLLASCASVPTADYRPAGEYVTASWYGPKFHGRPTASGERFDMNALTAAHKTLKFGTRLRVTNPDTGRSVVVTVNDRGPFIRGRDLDLSYAAAREIGLTGKGVGRVRIEYLGRNMRYARRVAFRPSRELRGPLSVQVGSFAEKSNAYRLKEGLETRYRDVFITRTYIGGRTYYRVRVGRFSSFDSAYRVAGKLADEGYGTFITTVD